MGTIFGMMIGFCFNTGQAQVEYYWQGTKYFLQLACDPSVLMVHQDLFFLSIFPHFSVVSLLLK